MLTRLELDPMPEPTFTVTEQLAHDLQTAAETVFAHVEAMADMEPGSIPVPRMSLGYAPRTSDVQTPDAEQDTKHRAYFIHPTAGETTDRRILPTALERAALIIHPARVTKSELSLTLVEAAIDSACPPEAREDGRLQTSTANKRRLRRLFGLQDKSGTDYRVDLAPFVPSQKAQDEGVDPHKYTDAFGVCLSLLADAPISIEPIPLAKPKAPKSTQHRVLILRQTDAEEMVSNNAPEAEAKGRALAKFVGGKLAVATLVGAFCAASSDKFPLIVVSIGSEREPISINDAVVAALSARKALSTKNIASHLENLDPKRKREAAPIQTPEAAPAAA